MPDVDLSGLPGIGDVPDALRVLMALGLAAFLVMLRFDAERFNAAEYDDVDRWGNKPSLVRRLAWYTLGIGGILAVLWIHPNPSTDLFLGLGNRLSAVMLGLAYGAIGTAIALGIALYRYHTRPAATGHVRTRARSSTPSPRRSSTRPSSAGCCSGTCSPRGSSPTSRT